MKIIINRILYQYNCIIHTYARTHIHTYTYIHTYMYIYIYIYIYIYMGPCHHKRTYVHSQPPNRPSEYRGPQMRSSLFHGINTLLNI